MPRHGSGEPLFTWLHLSDIHVGHGDATHQWDQRLVLDALTKDVRAQKGRTPEPNAVFVTGDIAFSGSRRSPDEYARARTWLVGIAKTVGLKAERVFVIPGNHDVERGPDEGHEARVAEPVREIRSGALALDTALSGRRRAQLMKRQGNYLAFAQRFAPACLRRNRRAKAQLFWQHRIEAPGLVIHLVGLNTAVLSANDLDHGRLRLGMEQLTQGLLGSSDGDLIVLLSHHPFTGGWLNDEASVAKWAAARAHVHLSGHLHVADATQLRRGSGGSVVQVAAGAVHEEKVPGSLPATHGYNIASVVRKPDGRLVLRIWPRVWSDRRKWFVADHESGPEEGGPSELELRLVLRARRQARRPSPRKETTGPRLTAQCRKLSARFGLFLPVGDLARPQWMSALLGRESYRSYYLHRPEDDLARRHLAEHRGVLIVGRPLSGMSRMALEAIPAAVPGCFVLRFSGPERFRDLAALAIPRRNRKKAPLVILFDDIDRFGNAPFDELIDRAREQVSALYVVATCRTGALRSVLENLAMSRLRRDFLGPDYRVEIRTLEPAEAQAIEMSVWKLNPGSDLGLDRTLAGAIVRGTKFLEDVFHARSPWEQHVLRAVYLAEACGRPCPPDLVIAIATRLAVGRAGDAGAAIETLAANDLLHADAAGRVMMTHDSHRLLIGNAHYRQVGDLKRDLQAVEDILTSRSDAAERLEALGLWYHRELSDLASARRVLETGRTRGTRAETLLALAVVHAFWREPVRAEALLEDCLQLLPNRDRRAEALLRYGDALLPRCGPAETAPFYRRALDLATEPRTRLAAAIHYGDVMLSSDRPGEAEPIYRAHLESIPDANRPMVAARLVLSIAGRREMERAARELGTLFEGATPEFRRSLASHLLQDAEVRLMDDRLDELLPVLWEAIRHAAGPSGKASGAELLGVAEELIFAGFLRMSKLAYAHLEAHLDQWDFDPLEHAVVINNLATSCLFLRQHAEARPLFEQTLAFLDRISEDRAYYRAAAEEGLARCDFLEGDLESAAARYRARRQKGGRAPNATVKAWARLGLGDVAWAAGDRAAAEEHYLTPLTIPNSFDTLSRAQLGIARICLHTERLDDAEIHIARGIALCARRDYAYRKQEFEALGRELAELRAARPTVPASTSGSEQ